MKNISSKEASDKLIFALDTNVYEDALSWVELLSGYVGMFKVGKELFTAVGPKIIKSIKKKSQRVFLDLKFHDIPHTVSRAVDAALNLKVDMLNVHASGGFQMMKEAVSAACSHSIKSGSARPVLLAVTVLTSLNDEDLKEIGFKKNTRESVILLAELAKKAGASGVVASAQDVKILKKKFGDEFIVVTPGIRSVEEEKEDDQKRTFSAYEAVKAGADYIVVGRPIRTAREPLKVCRQIVEEVAEGLLAK